MNAWHGIPVKSIQFTGASLLSGSSSRSCGWSLSSSDSKHEEHKAALSPACSPGSLIKTPNACATGQSAQRLCMPTKKLQASFANTPRRVLSLGQKQPRCRWDVQRTLAYPHRASRRVFNLSAQSALGCVNKKLFYGPTSYAQGSKFDARYARASASKKGNDVV